MSTTLEHLTATATPSTVAAWCVDDLRVQRRPFPAEGLRPRTPDRPRDALLQH